MTHDRPSKTRRGHARTYHFTAVCRFLGSGILLARRWKQKMADCSCRQFRTVLNINTSHTLNSVMLEWACLNKEWNKLGYIFMLIGVNSTSGRASGCLQSSRVRRRSQRIEELQKHSLSAAVVSPRAVSSYCRQAVYLCTVVIVAVGWRPNM